MKTHLIRSGLSAPLTLKVMALTLLWKHESRIAPLAYFMFLIRGILRTLMCPYARGVYAATSLSAFASSTNAVSASVAFGSAGDADG